MNMPKIKYFVANWKMNFTISDVKLFMTKWKEENLNNNDIKTIFCPSFTELSVTYELIKGTNFESLGMRLKVSGNMLTVIRFLRFLVHRPQILERHYFCANTIRVTIIFWNMV